MEIHKISFSLIIFFSHVSVFIAYLYLHPNSSFKEDHSLDENLNNAERRHASAFNLRKQMTENLKDGIDSCTAAAQAYKLLIGPSFDSNPQTSATSVYQKWISNGSSNRDAQTTVNKFSCDACKNAHLSIASSISAVEFWGNGSISVLCDDLTTKANAPMTSDECNIFKGELFPAALNILREMTSSSVLCKLITGECTATSIDNTKAVSCDFCEILHEVAHRIVSNFAQLFKGFYLMCNRLADGKEKSGCTQYVDILSASINELIHFQLSDINRDHFCTTTFKCTKN